MKIKGSIQEIKDFMKEFKSKDSGFSKQQLNQIRNELEKVHIEIDGEKVAEQITPSISKIFSKNY